MRSTVRFTVLLALLALVVNSCGSDCSPTDASCQPSDPRYELILVDAPLSLGAFVLEVRAGRAFALELSPTGADAESAGNGANTEWRAVIIGRPSAERIGTLVFDSAPSALPVATVVEAAAAAAQGYAILTGAMRIEVRRID